MASRFGATSASRSKNARLKILIACIFLLLLLFLAILTYVIQNQQQADGLTSAGPVQTDNQEDPNAGTVGVLVASFRIEEGSGLSEQMFTVDYINRTELPPNAVTADRQKTLTGKFARRILNPNVILLNDDISDVQPLTHIDIPAGFRLITIIVDARTGVEGWAKPSTRVDVLWTFLQDGNRKVATIARFVKVISVAGIAQNDPQQAAPVQPAGPVTVSLLVSEEQAKYIELARATGELSLVLVGGQEMPGTIGERPDIVDIKKILGDKQEKEEVEEVPDGVLYVEDPVTRKQKKYVLKNGRWTLDKNYTE
ncbi:MAG TPA: Flp pilus assembly protein CpaB [Oligoflexia bacterium]|nr:Flp pilus assembly protein CpaB [Oligoflexia bacterium]HMP47083.1 Flp pilus assembly protein CpaB [Oligoflexia bacterium]